MKNISAKKLKKLGGKMPFSSIQKRPKQKRGKAAIVRRRRSKAERERIYGPPGYVEWIHEQPCVACGYWRSVCAHIRTGGTGRKADWTTTVPLCASRPSGLPNRGDFMGCHVLYDEHRVLFGDVFQLDMEAEARRTNLAWSAHTQQLK